MSRYSVAVVALLALTAPMLSGCSEKSQPKLDSQYGKTLAEATVAAKKAGFAMASGHATSDAGLYDVADTWVVCEQHAYRWSEDGDWNMQFNLVAEAGDCPRGTPAPGLKEKYAALYGTPGVSPSSTPAQEPRGIAPEDDLDGDGWVDDPCPDKNLPLWAAC
ncbi:hypothetical protein [Streptomyces sp. bgisy126]|uniref:hypothetical protein n=1 Tax=unclassified Streptomyces TaxID=2593676 RepID=UPI003EBBD811